MVDVAPGLTSFATRPPTPPRERNHSVTKLANDNNADFNAIILQAGLDTPDDSPSSSGEYFGASAEKGSKRVVFSPWTRYHRPFSLGSKNAVWDGHIRPLPPSRDCQSSKSILKPYIETAANLDTKDPSAVDWSDIPAMLRSAAQHLASPSRSSRLDGYMTILGCLSAYDALPDLQALAERLLELTEYIRRDISARMEGTGAPDTQLATQALKLLATLLSTGKLGDLIPEDFASFITEQSISAVEDPETPKILVSHYMHLLVKQDFPPKVMSTDRVSRLLSVLDKVANRVNGNRVVGHRLMIYQRLLVQTKPLMKLRVGEWMDHLVAGMLSTIKDIRCRAIAFGLEAGLALGTTSTVSQACVDMFNRKSPEGTKVVDFLTSRLNEMVASKEDGVHVPPIWSVAILFLRSRRRQVERWEHLKTWLMIIQRCFNSSDPQMKFQANIAWNRLVFAVDPDTSTSSSMVKMLRQPIVSQLDRKTNDKHARHAKQIARSSYCNLLYYAFRPVPTHAQLDQYWDEYVSQVIPSSFSASTSDLGHACEILAALLRGTAPMIWDENRANTGGPIKPEDLPCLDPKWVRQRAAMILTIFEKILDTADWQLDIEEEAPIVLAWRSFAAAIGEAGNKEIKVSMESLIAVAQILTTIKHFWERSLRRQEAARDRDISEALQKTAILIKEAVAKIGLMPFTEKRLVQSSQDSFEAAETPSSRSRRHQGPLNTPILHLLHMVISGVGDGPISQAYRDVTESLIQTAVQSATSRRSKLAVLRDVAHLLPTEGVLQSPANLALWRSIATATKVAITLPTSLDNHSDSHQYLGHDYREVVKILDVGLQQQCVENLDAWRGLSSAAIDVLHEEVGDGGVILIFMEPLALALLGVMHHGCNEFVLSCALTLLEAVSWPQSRQVMERAQKALWGTSLASHKLQPLDPFNNVYTMVDASLSATYRQLESEASATMIRFLAAVASFLSQCPLPLKAIFIKRIQQGLGFWIEDAKGLMTHSKSEPNLDRIYTEAKKLWATVTAAIKGLPKTDSALLTSIQDLIVSGLTSRHQAILNQSIELWNCTFGKADFLEYRDDLRTALIKLRSVTEMQLPNFPADDPEVMSSPIHFIESQVDEDDLHSTLAREFRKWDALQRDTSPKPLAASLSQLSANSRKSSTRRSAEKPKPKTTSTARLRHNDSQIHFAAVASSSPLAPELADSQLLTERQKEVKERQGREAAAIFPNIRSSPRSWARDVNRRSPPRLVISGGHRSHPNLDADNDISPVLSSDDALMKDVLGSSPTPRSSRRITLDLGSDFEPPSSPPSLPPTGPLPILAQRQLEPYLTPPEILQWQNPQPKTQEVRRPCAEPALGPSDEEIIITNKQTNTMINNANPEVDTKISNADHHDRLDAQPFSEAGVCFDAPSKPVEEPPAAQSGIECGLADAPSALSDPQGASEAAAKTNFDKSVQQVATPTVLRDTPTRANGRQLSPQESEVSGIMDSFYDLSTSFYSNENDQIAAQLVNDLERASQQASPVKKEQIEPKGQVKKGGMKRKIQSGNLGRNSKRVKGLPSTRGIEVVVETRKPGDINDCVIIDSRPAIDGLSPLPQEVKQERSLSPSPFRDIRAVAMSHEAAVNPSRCTRSSRAGAPMIQNPPPSSKPRKATAGEVKKEKDGDADNDVAPPSRRRRSARLSQASVDGSQIQDVSSVEVYKNSAEVPSERLRPEFSSRERNNQIQSFSASESMDHEQDTSHPDEATASQRDHEHVDTPAGSRADVSGVAEEGAPPPLGNEALSHAPRKRSRPSPRKTAESRPVSGSVAGSLDEEGHDRKDHAIDRSRHLRGYDRAVQQNDNLEGAHASRSSAQGLLGSLRQWLGDIKQAALAPEEEREIVHLLFESVQGTHEAGRRNPRA